MPDMYSLDVEEQVQRFRTNIENLKNEIAKVIVGHQDVINQTIITILAGGHALLEGVPGIGKTLLVRTISRCLNLDFSRIQFTPDLMPADIVGTNIAVKVEETEYKFKPGDEVIPKGTKSKEDYIFEFRGGPIFGNIILADEINRATPKTQSALLEAMQEASVTVGKITYPLPQPFFVLATQNPIEMEGTYPLPEAQIDRFFFKIELKIPNLKELLEIVDRTTGLEVPLPKQVFDGKEIMNMKQLAREVPIAAHISEYVARLILSTHPNSDSASEMVKKYVRYGSSPRGAQSLVLSGKILALMKGRYNVSFNDIKESAFPALRHRLILNFEGEAEGIKPDKIISHLLETITEIKEKK